jgi:hypothetical protein
MKETSLIRNSQNFRKKDNKYKKERKAIRIERKDFEELLIKFRDTIDVQLRLVKDLMDPKVH